MRCTTVRRNLSAYLDECDPPRVRMAMGMHLSHCASCRDAYDELRRLRLALLNTPAVPAPAGFASGWRAALQAENAAQNSGQSRVWYLRANVLLPAAACLVLGLFGAFLLPQLLTSRQGTPRIAAHRPARNQPQDNAVTMAQNPEPRTGAAQGGANGIPQNTVPAGGDGATGGGGGSPGGFSSGNRPAVTNYGGTRPTGTDVYNPTRPAPAGEHQVDLTGSWRVWLSDLGDTPERVNEVLLAAGLPEIDLAQSGLDLPLSLCVLSVYSNAQNLMYRLEEAGAKVIVERLPQ